MNFWHWSLGLTSLKFVQIPYFSTYCKCSGPNFANTPLRLTSPWTDSARVLKVLIPAAFIKDARCQRFLIFTDVLVDVLFVGSPSMCTSTNTVDNSSQLETSATTPQQSKAPSNRAAKQRGRCNIDLQRDHTNARDAFETTRHVAEFPGTLAGSSSNASSAIDVALPNLPLPRTPTAVSSNTNCATIQKVSNSEVSSFARRSPPLFFTPCPSTSAPPLESPLVSTKSPVRITCVSQGDAVTEESNGAILEQFNVSASVWESPIHTSAEPPVWSTPRLVSTTPSASGTPKHTTSGSSSFNTPRRATTASSAWHTPKKKTLSLQCGTHRCAVQIPWLV